MCKRCERNAAGNMKGRTTWPIWAWMRGWIIKIDLKEIWKRQKGVDWINLAQDGD
jgi:hypothetical protein